MLRPSVTAPVVLTCGDWLNVVSIAAGPDAAQVVKHQTRRNGTVFLLVEPLVSGDFPTLPSGDALSSIPLTVEGQLPDVARGRVSPILNDVIHRGLPPVVAVSESVADRCFAPALADTGRIEGEHRCPPTQDEGAGRGAKPPLPFHWILPPGLI